MFSNNPTTPPSGLLGLPSGNVNPGNPTNIGNAAVPVPSNPTTAATAPNTGTSSAPATPGSTVASATHWMASMQIRSAPRNSIEQLGNQALITRQDRCTLNHKELTRLVKEIIEPLTQKFVAIDLGKFWTDQECDQIAHTASLTQTLNIARNHLKRYDLCHIFEDFPVLEQSHANQNQPHTWWNNRKTINLLEKYDSMKTLDVAKTVLWMRLYLDDETLNELAWTHSFFHNSCESESGHGSLFSLVASEVDRLIGINAGYSGGPVTLMIILSNLTSSSENAKKMLETKIKTLKITDMPGENISMVINQLSYVIRRLSQDKLPSDLSTNLITMFQTSSNSKFNKGFETLENCITMGTVTTPTWEELFDKANFVYVKAMHSVEGWVTNPTEHGPSGFKALLADVVCHHCKKPGHIRPNCPELQNDNSQGNGSNNTIPEVYRRPRSTLGDKKTPHGDKSCWSRTLNGETAHWCGRCKKGGWKGMWTTGPSKHFTDEHPGANVRANIAVDNEESSTTDQSTTRVTFSDALTSFQDAAN